MSGSGANALGYFRPHRLRQAALHIFGHGVRFIATKDKQRLAGGVVENPAVRAVAQVSFEFGAKLRIDAAIEKIG